jgi:protocatechuate 3,4-dioxygenase beta subunit
MSLLTALTLAVALGQSPTASTGAVISGQVLEDVTRAPIAGAQVTLVPSRPPSGPAQFYERPRSVVTDQDGRYTFEGIEPGRYRISVQKTGFTRLDAAAAMPEVNVAAGERAGSVNITLQRGAVITGRVLDEDGQPLVDARIMPMRRVPAGRGRSTPNTALVPAGAGTQTNDLGEFRLHSLSPGEHYVMATPRDDLGPSAGAGARKTIPTYFPSAPDAAGAQPIHVSGGQTLGDVEIRMSRAPAFHISGVVIDEAGRPVVNAMVRLNVDDPGAGPRFMMMGRSMPSRTDSAGRFTIEGVVSGSYTLMAMAPVLISRAPDRSGMGSGSASFGMSSSIGGTVSNEVTTETRNGTTVEYRGENATRVQVAVGHADITGLEIVARR